MEFQTCIELLTLRAAAIFSLIDGVSEEQARWKPDPRFWSILEVVNHLHDEEREDFRRHLDDVLHHPDQAWAGISPQEWVSERKYNERDLDQSGQDLRAARAESLEWLKGLESPDWEKACNAPFGPIQAGEILVSWCAHDLLHMRQLVELHWAYGELQAEPYSVAYAGPW
jgi:hypothetical protein